MVQQQVHRVDPKIWQECGGDSVPILKLNSKLDYFPRGHWEHACPNYPTTQTLSLINNCRPIIHCVISGVDLFADSKTDELVAKLLLTPISDATNLTSELHGEDDGDHIVSYAKTLTQSDANNGGAFSVPLKCAKSIFPPLDYSSSESPSQNLSLTDFHGRVWNFRHVYSGKPKRHLITHGWSAFSDHKKLISGDTVVFLKDLAGNITIGFRREKRFAAAANVTVKAVTKAAELAHKNTPFEVMYYPTTGGFDFVVGSEVVEEATKIEWIPGMSVKYSVKFNDDTSKGCSVFHGKISTIAPPSIAPWRMLQVDWNEPTVSTNMRKVSPWQVELIINIPTRHSQVPPSKKIRAPHTSALFKDHTFPDGMQGATPTFFDFFKDDSMKESDNVPTEQNINSPVSDDLSPSSRTEIAGTDNCNNKKVTSSSIILFGQIIPIDKK